MLTKYTLVNVRKGGVDHLVNGRRWSITDALTDDQADYLIKNGLKHYFRAKRKSNAKTTKASGANPAGATNTTSGPSDAPINATSGPASAGATSSSN